MKTLRQFFTLGVIVGVLPVNIADGQIADAVPVMANFNWIVSQVNANAAPAFSTIASAGSYSNNGLPGNLSNGVAVTVGATATPLKAFDLLSEWSAGVFTSLNGGLYVYQASVDVTTTGATITGPAQLNFVTGGGTLGALPYETGTPPSTGELTLNTVAVFKCPIGGTIKATVLAQFSGGTVALFNWQTSFVKVG